MASETAQVVKWLMEKTHTSLEVLSHEIGVDKENLKYILEGKKTPSRETTYKLARFFRVSPAYIALGIIPKYYEVEKYVKDFRGRKEETLSVNARALVSHLYRIIEIYKTEFQPYPKSFVGEFGEAYQTAVREESRLLSLVHLVAERIRTLLSIPALQEEVKNEQEFYRQLLTKLEKLGVNVVESSTVGNRTSWKISSQDFEGLAIADLYLPTIFIHTGVALTKGRRIFTLIHELTHILIGSSVYDFPLEEGRDTESFFNRVTTEVLMPEEEFKELWEYHYSKTKDLEKTTNKIQKHFKTSTEAIYYRAYKLEYISRKSYQKARETAIKRAKEKKAKETDSPGGPSFWQLLPGRFGHFYIKEIMQAVRKEKISIHEAADYVGIHTVTFYKYLEKQKV